jgi:hypothetical protein
MEPLLITWFSSGWFSQFEYGHPINMAINSHRQTAPATI